MTHVTADVIFRTMFSTALSQDGAAKLYDAFIRFQESAFVAGFLESTWLPAVFAAGRKRKAEQAGREIRQLIEPFVRDLTSETRFVNGRNFFRNGNQWTDALCQSVKKDAKRVQITFNSDAYFELMDKHPKAIQYQIRPKHSIQLW